MIVNHIILTLERGCSFSNVLQQGYLWNLLGNFIPVWGTQKFLKTTQYIPSSDRSIGYMFISMLCFVTLCKGPFDYAKRYLEEKRCFLTLHLWVWVALPGDSDGYQVLLPVPLLVNRLSNEE
jgi:hypothetical protein